MIDDAIRALVRELVHEELRRVLGERTAPSEFLTVGEAAEVARVAPGTVRRWVREGRLARHQAGRVVRVRRDQLEELMRGEPHAGTAPEQLADLEYDRRRGSVR